MPVLAEVTTVSPNAAEIAWKFVPEMSTLGGRGVCVIHVAECPVSPQAEGDRCADASMPTNALVLPSAESSFSSCIIANESPFWIEGLSASTRYSVRVGGMPSHQQSGTPEDRRSVNVDSSSAWAWSAAVQFTTPSTSE
jgi:hypothetical protein